MAMTYAASRGKSFRFFASSLTAWKAAVVALRAQWQGSLH
jgi:hypothetical protein